MAAEEKHPAKAAILREALPPADRRRA
jgi:hypothetical protein